jgi:glycosyltransferase involved in cell wall biosynthesis
LEIGEKKRGKMNIWMLNHYAATPDLSTGTRHFDFGMELSRRGHNITVFASGSHPARSTKKCPPNNDRYLVEEINNNFRFIWVKTFRYEKNDWKRVVNMLSYSRRVPQIVKSLNLKKPDIIIGSSVHLFAVLTGYLLSRKFGSYFIMEVRDLWPETLIDMGVPRWHPFIVLLGLLERFLYKRADKIIVLPPKANEYIESLGISSHKIRWVPNGVDVSKFNINGEDDLNKSNNEFVVMYVGALATANNLDVAIDSADILKDNYPNIKFVFVGDGIEKPKLVQKTELLKLDNVEFRNPVEKGEIPGLLRKADALFFNLPNLPVFKYGISSNKLFDYLASGKPIIFSCSSINNPVDEADAGITISPGNPQALAEAVVKLHNIPAYKRQEMGKRGKDYVKKYHDIPVLVDSMEEVFKEALEKKE